MASAPSAVEGPPAEFTYEHADRCADIVMKGGVTSGVVYPLAVCELAQTYRFRSIGGTSVGAIAAAAAAAAELGRYRDPAGPGFRLLQQLPAWLGVEHGSRTNLISLFRPQPRTRSLFETLVAALRHAHLKPVWLVVGAVRRFWLASLAGAALGLALLGASVAGLVEVPGWEAELLFSLAAVGAVLVTLLGALAGGTVGFALRAFSELPRNAFGLCAGAGGAGGAERAPAFGDAQPGPLSTWLADFLDELAGQGPGAGPLTFGDLWWAGEEERRPRPPESSFRPEAERAVNLAMMTTCLTLGRPHRLPFTETSFSGGELLVFEGRKLRDFFPERIVRVMEDRGRERIDAQGLTLPGGYFPLPEAADLPVVVAARLSMSFPLLLSALPLHLWHPSCPFDPVATRCWFSDGGICSNFPVHFFDSPLPRWPTFGINLRGPRRRDSRTAWLAPGYDENVQESWEEIEGLMGFVFSIKDVAQNWLDNAQQRLPGWRDRVANVGFREGEGGLNLYMSGPVIAELSRRGWQAGSLLGVRFARPPAGPDALSWESHRWVRYRSSLATLSRFLAKICRGWEQAPCASERPEVCGKPADERAYLELVDRDLAGPPRHFPFENEAQRECARRETLRLVDLVGTWEAGCFRDAPRPEPVLRIAPDV